MIFSERIEKLKILLPKLGCEAFLVEDRVNLYYLTGCELSAGKLLVSDKDATLLVDGRYFEYCKERSPVKVVLLESGKNQLRDFLNRGGKLGFDSDRTSYQRYLELTDIVYELVPLKDPIKNFLRIRKDKEEILQLKEAAELGSKGYDHVCSCLKEGISELELASELEIFWKRQGSKGVAFEPIIAFGPNSSMPHYRAGEAKLKQGDSVLIDIGVNLNHYHSDMTRVYFFGKPNPELQKIYNIVKEAQEAALKLCRPGILVGDLDEAARSIIASYGYGENFTHSLGHGVGLEIHELPVLRNSLPYKEVALQAGMVITIEPGIYLPGIGGVRLEDTVVITEKGHDNLTKRPK